MIYSAFKSFGLIIHLILIMIDSKSLQEEILCLISFVFAAVIIVMILLASTFVESARLKRRLLLVYCWIQIVQSCYIVFMLISLHACSTTQYGETYCSLTNFCILIASSLIFILTELYLFYILSSIRLNLVPLSIVRLIVAQRL